MVFVSWEICRWHLAPPLFERAPLRVLGAVTIAAGIPVLLDSFARFAMQSIPALTVLTADGEKTRTLAMQSILDGDAPRGESAPLP
jgi:hypothetical protein